VSSDNRDRPYTPNGQVGEPETPKTHKTHRTTHIESTGLKTNRDHKNTTSTLVTITRVLMYKPHDPKMAPARARYFI
ncbi:Hypothetical predicted protein, partial [Pelobates cultripes]